jgi:hypothetical protein
VTDPMARVCPSCSRAYHLTDPDVEVPDESGPPRVACPDCGATADEDLEVLRAVRAARGEAG